MQVKLAVILIHIKLKAACGTTAGSQLFMP